MEKDTPARLNPIADDLLSGNKVTAIKFSELNIRESAKPDKKERTLYIVKEVTKPNKAFTPEFRIKKQVRLTTGPNFLSSIGRTKKELNIPTQK